MAVAVSVRKTVCDRLQDMAVEGERAADPHDHRYGRPKPFRLPDYSLPEPARLVLSTLPPASS